MYSKYMPGIGLVIQEKCENLREKKCSLDMENQWLYSESIKERTDDIHLISSPTLCATQ